MGFFSQGKMQRHPLIKGSTFSNWRLHARIILETFHQVSLFLDFWHVRHIFDLIKTHEPDATKLILNINLATLTSHFTSRSRRHIQLNYFVVSPLSMSCVALQVLLCFASYECCLLYFNEHLLSFLYILACTSTVLVFVNISLLSRA